VHDIHNISSKWTVSDAKLKHCKIYYIILARQADKHSVKSRAVMCSHSQHRTHQFRANEYITGKHTDTEMTRIKQHSHAH